MKHKFKRLVRIIRNEGVEESIRRISDHALSEINNIFYRANQADETKVTNEDWDNLIILDACRYDMFERRNTLSGMLHSRISLGSTSEEFLERNFGGETFHDIVYVNTNPYVPRLSLDEGTFHAVVDLLDQWDTETQTVNPKTVVNAAIETHEEFPNKRLIIHFMQPHYPFIGEAGQELEGHGWVPKDGSTDVKGRSIWQILRRQAALGESIIREEDVWDAYEENLDIVLEHVEELLDEVGGKTVITADHGNLIGQRESPIPVGPVYGHPYGRRHPDLVRVPWFVVEAEERRRVRADPPVSRSIPDDDTVNDRLEALGYKEQ